MWLQAWNFGGIILPPMLGASSNPFDVFSVFDGFGYLVFFQTVLQAVVSNIIIALYTAN